MKARSIFVGCTIATAFGTTAVTSFAQSSTPATAAVGTASTSVASVSTPTDYVIGPDDRLSVLFWRDKDISADVVVRPDGKISLPLLNEVQAAGFTPEQLRTHVADVASKYIEQPNVTVVVREIHSRNVFITGKVTKSGTFTLTNDMTVMQLIALAGGLLEYADERNIVVIRTDGGRQQYHHFNYHEVIAHKNPQQNIVLRPGDTVVVP